MAARDANWRLVILTYYADCIDRVMPILEELQDPKTFSIYREAVELLRGFANGDAEKPELAETNRQLEKIRKANPLGYCAESEIRLAIKYAFYWALHNTQNSMSSAMQRCTEAVYLFSRHKKRGDRETTPDGAQHREYDWQWNRWLEANEQLEKYHGGWKLHKKEFEQEARTELETK